MYSVIREWLGLYFMDRRTNDPSSHKIIMRRYTLIRKTLRKNFRHDTNIAKYVKTLPRAWRLKSRNFTFIAITIVILPLIVFGAFNDHVFKIYTGVTVNYRGMVGDGIYVLIGIIWSAIAFGLIYMWDKIPNTLPDRLTDSLREIEKILSQRK